MKKNLTLSIIIFFTTWISFGQLENAELVDIITINVIDHDDVSTALTVPAGKLWVLNSQGGHKVYAKINGGSSFIESETFEIDEMRNIPFLYTEGMQITFSQYYNPPLIQILEYKSPSGFDGTLAIEESSLPKENLILFPNPTDSELTINSDKIFKVEVYDLMGRKMFETNSTSIDFTELKTGIYLVNLFDEADKIVSTYKVIKN